jgi:hypothetical protein
LDTTTRPARLASTVAMAHVFPVASSATSSAGLQQWAFCCMRGSPGAKAYYQALRARGIGHQGALRQLSNRLVGILHGCLTSHTLYNENTAWQHHVQSAA